MLHVSDLMTCRLVSVGTDATLGKALTYLATQHISGAAVDEAGQLVGVSSRSDVSRAFATGGA